MTKTSIQIQFEKIKTRELNTKPVVVAYGLMNSGKSSLLNMLTENVEPEFFKTNDIRETIENKGFEGERYIYLDTPGLDANNEDDNYAESGVNQADIVLFVHQPQGELEANEIEFLRKLLSSFGEYASQHIIIVLSKMEKEEAEKIQAIERRIHQQCQTELGFSATIFQVSNKRFQAGILKSQQALISRSNIPELAAHLARLAATATAPRARRAMREIDVLLHEVEQAEQQLRADKSQLRSQISHAFARFNHQIEHLHTYLDVSASDFKRL